MADFLHMGGYATTVWTSYGAAAVILVGLLVVSLRQAARRRADLERLEAERDRRSPS
jgi:heme exporter protein D